MHDLIRRAEAYLSSPEAMTAADDLISDLLAALKAQPAPIDMLLFCPKCGDQHVDAPNRLQPIVHTQSGTVVDELWTNPPHRSHLCHSCGCVWRPADVPTNGVAALKTQGKGDTWAALKAQQPSSAGQTAPQVTQGDNGGRGFTVTQIHGKEVTLAGGGGGATYLVEVQGGGKAQQPAPVGDDGLPPLPEPDGVAEVNRESHPDGGYSYDEVPTWSEPLVRRAQREAVAAYVLKCQREARTAVETIRQGAKT